MRNLSDGFKMGFVIKGNVFDTARIYSPTRGL